MYTTELKGNWNEQKGKLKQKFAILSDNDMIFGIFQIKLGKTKKELRKIISAVIN
jgi:hypothetical protein